jgi:DNA-binding HxlR family transcriptional regulator
VHNGSSGQQLGMRHNGQWSPLARALSATGDDWTLLIALALAREAQRPVQLQRKLTGISSGVLDRHLQHMVALGLLTRKRYKEMPPRVELKLTEAGHELLPIAGALARWGMRHVWSAPVARERVDVEVLLELLPVILHDAGPLPDGTLELAVRDAEGSRTALRFAIERGRLGTPARDAEGQDRRPQASVVADTSGWIAALGPTRDYAQLRFTGRRTLARQVLEALPATAPEQV